MRTVTSTTSSLAKVNKLSFLSVIFLILATISFSSTAVAQTQLRLAKTWNNALLGDEITATTSGDAVATVNSVSNGINTDFGTPVAVAVGNMITLNAEVFNVGIAGNYFASDWVCDDAASSTIAAGGTLEVMAGDLNNLITCTVTNQLSNIVEGVSCLNNPSPATFIPNCTANDLALSSPAVTVVKPCNFPGDTAILEVDTIITTTASQRYDIGLWFSIDGDPNGDGSKSGQCTVVSVPNNLIDADGNPTNVDGDFCGDVSSTAAGPPDVPQTQLGVFSLLCEDNDGDGLLDVPLLVAYDNAAGNVCTDAQSAIPPNKAKCQVDLEQSIPVPIPGRIIVNKTTVPADATDFDFNLSGPVSPVPMGFDGDEDFMLANGEQFDSSIYDGGLVAGNDYMVTETPNAAYDSVGVCSSDVDGGNTDPLNIDLRAGETVTCEFTNTIISATINVVKNTSGGNGMFDINWTGPSTMGTFNLDTMMANTDTDQLVTSDIGDFDLTENIPAGWALTGASCINDNGGAPIGTPNATGVIDIGLTNGMSVTCTFNNALLGTVNVVKNTNGGDGTFDFVTDLPGGNFNRMTAGGSSPPYSVPNVPAGVYSIVETVPAGWNLDSATCDDGSSPDALDVSDGETVTCTFTNTKLGTVIVEKQTLPDGSGETFDFAGDIAGTIGDGGQIIVSNLLPATYTSTETVPAGWVLTSVICDDGGSTTPSTGDTGTATATFNLDAGETVTCVFTNTQDGSIEVVKDITAEGPPSKVFGFTSDFNGNFNLEPADAATDATTGPIAVTPGGPYSVTEDFVADWELTNVFCTGAQPSTALNVAPGQAVVCTFTNAPNGSASVTKNTLGGTGDFEFTWGTLGDGDIPNGHPATFNLDTTGDNTESASFDYDLIIDETYDLTESMSPANVAPYDKQWRLDTVSCPGETVPGANGADATIAAGANETASCTFLNVLDATLVIRKETIPESPGADFTFTGDANGTISDFSATAEELFVSGAPGGSFTSTETVPAGWEITDISCTGTDPGNITIGADNVDVDPLAGETVICTFENTAQGSIEIVKQSVGGTGGFSFNGTFGVFMLDTGSSNPDSVTYTSLLPGQYMVSEVVPTDWTLSDISCTGDDNSTILIGGDGDFDPNDVGVTIDLLGGDAIVCTFVNNAWGSIAVMKETLPDGSGQSFNFTGDVAADLTDGQTSMAVSVPAGNYSSTETPVAGWDLTDITCDDGNSTGDTGTGIASFVVEDGEDVVCTFTNTQRASITLNKVLPNDNGGTAVATDFQAFLSGNPVAWGVATEVLPDNTYTASETTLSGYAPSAWSGNCADNGDATPGPGENLVCSITNDDVQPLLTLTKIVVNDNGGTLVVSDFPLFVDGSPVDSGVQNGFNAGNYTASETTQDGYAASAWGGDCAADGTVSLAVGEVKACTITNNDIEPLLTVTKVVVNDNGGTLMVSDFPLFVDATPVTSGVQNGFAAGNYTVSENKAEGYAAGDWGGDCAADGSVTLAPGDVKACSITNDDIQPLLTVTKIVVNDNGGTLVVSDFPLFVDATGVDSGVQNGFDVGDYTVSETEDPGYAASVWGGDCAEDGSISLAAGDEASCTITNDDIGPLLTLTKVVVNDNGGTLAVSDFPLFVDATPVDSGVQNGFDAGDYVASETGQSGYEAGLWTGDCDDNGNVTLALADVAQCTIINDDIQPLLTLTKIVVNDNGGTLQVSDFPLFVDATGVVSGVQNGFDAGDYTASETEGDGYAASVWSGDCADDGSISLAVGDVASCTITNDDITAHLILIKQVDNGLGGNGEPSDWLLSADGPTPISDTGFVEDDVDAGVYLLNEELLDLSVQAGGFYSTDGWDCPGASLSGSQLTLGLGEVVTCTIINKFFPAEPVPVNNPLALLLMILTMLATGWYFRPAYQKRF